MNTPRFLYHASAVGLSGEVRRPFQQPIHVQAASALPRYGGHAHSRVDHFQLADIVAHSTATTQATGVYQPATDSFETSIQAKVTDLNVRQVVTADLIAAQIHSSHLNDPAAEPHITVTGSEIKGLRIAGRDIILEPRLDIYSQLATMTGLRDHYKDNAQFREDFERAAFVDNEAALLDDVRPFFPWRRRKKSATLHEHRGVAIVPLYTIRNPSEEGFQVFGNVVKIPDFGRVHVGELIIESHRRRVMMLHVDMGSPCDADVTCCCSDGNGTCPPPPDGGGGNN